MDELTTPEEQTHTPIKQAQAFNNATPLSSTLLVTSEDTEQFRAALTGEISLITNGLLSGSLDYDKFLEKIIDIDQADPSHTASEELWATLIRPDVSGAILNAVPIHRPTQMADGSTQNLPVDPKERYYVALGLEYFHVMQALAISQKNPLAAKEFLFKDPEVITHIRQYSLNEADKDYLNGTLVYWKEDLNELDDILTQMKGHLGETDEERAINSANFEVIKRLNNGLKTRGTIDYAQDYAGIKP